MSVVYFLRIGKLIKIGFTTQPIEKRIAEIGAGTLSKSDVIMTVPGGRKEERRFHELFAESHVHRELFRRDFDLEQFIFWAKERGVDYALKDLKETRDRKEANKRRTPAEQRAFTKSINDKAYAAVVAERIRLRTIQENRYRRVPKVAES